jgi:hypothetical protein
MVKLRILALLPVSALMSCGAPTDVAENIPNVGKWSDESKLMSVRLGGTPIDTSGIPEFAQVKEEINKTKEFCGEPYFLEKEQFQELLDKNNELGCKVDTIEVNGERVNTKGSCKADQLANVDREATFKGVAKLGPDKVVFDGTIDVVVRNRQTGAGEKLSMEVQRKMTRLGDC